MDKLKLIKITVFVLTFLLVFGSLVFLGSLFKKINTKPTAISAEINLEEPAGSSVQSIKTKDGIMYILVKDGGKPDRIIMFDTIKGQKLSTIRIN